MTVRLTRRTRISIETFDRGVACARPLGRDRRPILGWTPEQVDRELEHYLRRVEAERAPQNQPDDETADAARLGAPRSCLSPAEVPVVTGSTFQL